MTFTLSLKTSNAAFHDEYDTDADSDARAHEAARILRHLADRLIDSPEQTTFALIDVNGNCVGDAGFTA